MAYQYTPHPHLQPQPQASPLLDSQNNPTPLIISFANAVFDWLDNSHAPKGSGMLEPQKMKAISEENVDHYGDLASNILYQAFSVETVFTASGPALTRAGFLTFLRIGIMCDPDEALRSFNTIVTASRVGPFFHRSQFPQVQDPETFKIMEKIQVYFRTLLDGIQAGLAKDLQRGNAQRNQQARTTALLNMATQQADAQFARNAAASERMGWIGTGACYTCGKHRCGCRGYVSTDIFGSI